VGKDKAGDELVQLLQDKGVDATGVQSHPKAPTRQVNVLRSESGDRIFAGFRDHDTTEFADTRLQASQLPVQLFEAADFLVLGTLELAYPDSRDSVLRALQLAEQYDVKILLDVNWRPVFWPNPDTAPQTIKELFRRIDFLKLSTEEAEWLFDTTDAGAIKYRLDSVEGVLVTAGEHGCRYCLSENEGKLPAFSVPVVDTTGAGDSFVAGFVHQLDKLGIQKLADPQTAQRVVMYASAAGALTTMNPGAIAAQPTAAQVEAFLNSHPHP
jgi:fructokinase